MTPWLAAASEAFVLIPIAVVASWIARTTIRTFTRRAVRRAQRSNGLWRVRLDRLGDNGQADARRRQRADAVARMLGHLVTVIIVALSAFWALELLGVDAVFAISSAGFIGVAIALSGQDLVKDFLAGTRALLEDRYAVGDEVVLQISAAEVRGTVDLIGTASLRLRTPDGATWHAGHASIESVTNLSQLPSVSDIDLPVKDWSEADERAASERLADASNDLGLTGVVFLRDIETHEPDDVAEAETVTVRVKSNRPLSSPEADLVRSKLSIVDRCRSAASGDDAHASAEHDFAALVDMFGEIRGDLRGRRVEQPLFHSGEHDACCSEVAGGDRRAVGVGSADDPQREVMGLDGDVGPPGAYEEPGGRSDVAQRVGAAVERNSSGFGDAAVAKHPQRSA